MQYILSLSYGKDSLACLGAIEELGWPLDKIVHIEIWATETIQADPPPMVEFKAKYEIQSGRPHRPRLRAALNNTFSVITKFRRQLEKGTNDLLTAVDAIANRNNLSPIGPWTVQYDWSSAYIEQMNEHFTQLTMAEGIGPSTRRRPGLGCWTRTTRPQKNG